MISEPRHPLGFTLGEYVAGIPLGLNDLPVGMFEIVRVGRNGFELEGEALVDFIRRCIYSVMDAGAKPVIGAGKPNQWILQVQYGANKREVAEAVIAEWLRQGALTPEPWRGLWFGLPWSYQHTRG